MILFAFFGCTTKESYDRSDVIFDSDAFFYDYYYSSNIKIKKYDQFDLLYIGDFPVIKGEYDLDTFDDYSIHFDNIIHDLNNKQIINFNEMGMHFIIGMLPYYNDYVDFENNGVSGLCYPTLRMILIADLYTTDEVEKIMGEKAPPGIYNERVVHEFSHLISSHLISDYFIDECFANFLSFYYYTFNEEDRTQSIIELISFINSKEPYIDNENKIVHGNLLNVFESNNIPDYYKEEFFGCYLVFLADQGMYDEINSFIVSENVSDYWNEDKGNLYHQFLNWFVEGEK